MMGSPLAGGGQILFRGALPPPLAPALVQSIIVV